MNNKSLLRENIVKILYETYIYEKSNVTYSINDLIKEQQEVDNKFVTEAVNYIKKNQTNINNIANKYLKNWDIDRLSPVDKAIFSLAIYELKYTDTPKIVAINEAIELAKKYSDDKVVAMVNASLDKLYHDEVQDE